MTFYDSVAICIHLADVKISIFQDIFGKDVILSEVDNKSDQFSGRGPNITTFTFSTAEILPKQVSFPRLRGGECRQMHA